MDSNSVLQLISLLILIALSAFFSSAETALTTVNTLRINTLADDGDGNAKLLKKIFNKHSKMLSTILIGNNIVNISASAITTVLANNVWGNFAISIATGVLTFVVLIFGEIVPKTIATAHAETVSLKYAHVIYALIVIFTPFVFIIDKFSDGIFYLLHFSKERNDQIFTETEIKTILDASHKDGEIDLEEREMIYNVFDFSDSLAKDIMVPRVDMTAIDINATYNELLDCFKSSMYTRIPVYKDNSDNIIGLINIKDVLLIPQKKSFKVTDILRNAYYTYEYKKTADLLMEMQANAESMAMVLNEYGATEGIVTLEDLLEEIVGEIHDEFDADENESIQELKENVYLIDASMKLDDINDAISTDFYSEDYDSIGGLMIELLDKIPSANEEVLTKEGHIIRATQINKNRIEKVILILNPHNK